MDKTLLYYENNAETFIDETVKVNFSDVADRFLAYLHDGAAILDYGCGSGRDTRYFLERGFLVEAVDGSEKLCRYASCYTGIPVKCMLFQELEEYQKYDGIWACASVLHVAKKDLPGIFERMIKALKENGIIYVSFKYGDSEENRKDRFFSDFTLESFTAFSVQFPELRIMEKWISGDVRPGRGEERWLNVILKKTVMP